MGQVQRFDCIYKIVCFNFSNMSINYRYPIIAALTLLTAVACEEEKPVTDALSSSYTMEVGSAVYNDVAGSFDIGLVSDGISLDFSLTQQNSAILSDVPVPMVGHYTMSSYDISYVVSPGAVWIDAQEQEHSITEAEVHVNVNGTSCSMTGTVSDEEGYTFDFTCGDIVFSHSIDRTTAVDNVYGESLGDVYSLYLYGEADALAASLRAAGIPCEREAEGVRVPMQDAAAAREFLMRRADLADDFEFIKGNMDDVFLSVTGRKWSEGGEA